LPPPIFSPAGTAGNAGKARRSFSIADYRTSGTSEAFCMLRLVGVGIGKP